MKRSFSYSVKLTKNYNSVNVGESIESEIENNQVEEDDWKKAKQLLMERVDTLAKYKLEDLK